MPGPAPEHYGLTEQETADLGRDLEARSNRIGFRVATAIVALFCLYAVVTEGVLVGLLIAVSAGLLFLLIGSIVASGLVERWIILTDPRMARYHRWKSEMDRQLQQERRSAAGDALPRDIQRIIDGEASAGESRRTISKYLGHNNW